MRQPCSHQAAGKGPDYAEPTSSGSHIRQATTAAYGITGRSALCVLCRYRHKTHWSGAKHRLNRDFTGRFGSEAYAREELVAEMGSAFICASLGIVPTVRHADYVGNWLAVLKNDARAIVSAASHASKASDFLLAFTNTTSADAEEAA